MIIISSDNFSMKMLDIPTWFSIWDTLNYMIVGCKWAKDKK